MLSNIKIGKMNCYRYNIGLWEYDPVMTELHAYSLLKGHPIDRDINYLAFPWSMLQHFKQLDTLPKLKLGGGFTICQTIYYEQIIPILQEMGVDTLFTPHVYKDYSGIKVLPFPHYPVNAITSSTKKDILLSFVGAIHTHPVRKKMLEMPKKDNVFIKERKVWHFDRNLYKPKCMTEDEQQSDSLEYKDVLARSRFSLCPAGRGASTIRFWESLAAGAIPVLVCDLMRLPQVRSVNWDECIIRIPEESILQVNDILDGISVREEESMRSRCLKAYEFLSGKNFVNCIREYYGQFER